MIRVFVGIKTSPSLDRKIIDWQKKFHYLPIRFLDKNNLHLTLIPPWYIKSNSINTVVNKLKGLKNYDPVVLRFNSIEFGPNPHHSRLVWIKGEPNDNLQKFHTLTHQALSRKKENRPILTHVTIARFNPKNFANFPVKKINEAITWQDTVDNITLFQSILSLKGAEYHPLYQVSFK